MCVFAHVYQEVEGLAARLCKVLHSSPNEFGSLEVKVTETKEAVDVGHTDAAFLIVSCVDEKGASPPPRYMCCAPRNLDTLLIGTLTIANMTLSLLYPILKSGHSSVPFLQMYAVPVQDCITAS